MNIRLGVYLLGDAVLAGLLLCALAYGRYAYLSPGTDMMGYGAAALLVGLWFAAPALALLSIFLAALVRWRGDRLHLWERVAAYMIATGGLIPAVVLIALFIRRYWPA
jgi:hypothetical protein